MKIVSKLNILVATCLTSLGRDINAINQAIESKLNAGNIVSQDASTRNITKDANADTTINIVSRTSVDVVTAFHEYAGENGVIARLEAKAIKLGMAPGKVVALPTFKGHNLNDWVMRDTFKAKPTAPARRTPRPAAIPTPKAPVIA